MNPKKFITVAIVLVSILTGCSTGSDSANLSAAEFLVKSQEPGVITLDVRTPEEFRSGFIAKSLNINVESGSFDSEIANLDKSATYAVYCRSEQRHYSKSCNCWRCSRWHVSSHKVTSLE